MPDQVRVQAASTFADDLAVNRIPSIRAIRARVPAERFAAQAAQHLGANSAWTARLA